MTFGGGSSHQRTGLRPLVPCSRENTGKFADFGLESAKVPRLSEENSIAYQVNFLVAKAGKIYERSGKPEAVNSESDSLGQQPFGMSIVPQPLLLHEVGGHIITSW
jgi:hypothetical protein